MLYEHSKIQAARRIVTPEHKSLGSMWLMSCRCWRKSSEKVWLENVLPQVLHWYRASLWPKCLGV